MMEIKTFGNVFDGGIEFRVDIFFENCQNLRRRSGKLLISSKSAEEGTNTSFSLLRPRQKFMPPITLSTKR